MDGAAQVSGAVAVALVRGCRCWARRYLLGANTGRAAQRHAGPATRGVAGAVPASAVPRVSRRAVRQPGVYSVAAGSRLQDLLSVAGGAPSADLEAVNLAARLQDEEHVGDSGAGSGRPAGWRRARGRGARRDGPARRRARHKSEHQRRGCDDARHAAGIGPALAARIVEYRALHGRFAAPAAIQDVPGIGAKLYELIASQIVAGP